MPSGFKADERCTQAVSLPVRCALAPVVRVARDGEENLVMTPVLIFLVGVITLHSHRLARRANQCQPDGMVVALVRPVLHIGENRRTPRATGIGQIDPVMRCNFKLSFLLVWPLDGADLP